MTDHASASHPQTGFDIHRNMSDSQLRQTWTQITTAAHAAYASPTPQPAHSKGMA